MTEHELIGYVFMGTLGAFFLLGLPGFAVWRRFRPAGKPPEIGKQAGVGRVPTWSILPLDLVVATGYIALFVAAWKVSGKVDQKEALSNINVWAISGNAMVFLFFASVIPLVMFWRVRPVEFFGLKWQGWRWIFLIIPCFLVGVVILAGLIAVTGWQGFVKENFGGNLQATVQLVRETKDLALIGAMISAAVIGAPIAEEIIFRGYLYPVAKKYTSQWFAVLFTGMLFGVVHMNLMGLPMLVLIGMGLAIVYEITGSLWVPVFCHMAFNAMSMSFMLLSRFVPMP